MANGKDSQLVRQPIGVEMQDKLSNLSSEAEELRRELLNFHDNLIGVFPTTPENVKVSEEDASGFLKKKISIVNKIARTISDCHEIISKLKAEFPTEPSGDCGINLSP